MVWLFSNAWVSMYTVLEQQLVDSSDKVSVESPGPMLEKAGEILVLLKVDLCTLGRLLEIKSVRRPREEDEVLALASAHLASILGVVLVRSSESLLVLSSVEEIA